MRVCVRVYMCARVCVRVRVHNIGALSELIHAVAVVRCSDGPCLNSGQCVVDLPRGFTCDCHANFTGSICETGRYQNKLFERRDRHRHSLLN